MIERLLTSRSPAPDWTDANAHDPGITQLQLFAYAAEGLLFQRDATQGRVNGLSVQAEANHNPAAVNVSPGLALSGEGQPIDLSAAVSRYIGETEKNLASRFGEAAASDAVLCNDDADALFDRKP